MIETYHTRLQRIRREKKIKQIDAADAADVVRPYISDLENGKKDGSLEVILKLANFYDVSLDYIFGKSSLPHTQPSESIAHDEKERILLQIWRHLSAEEQAGLMLLLQSKVFGPSAA
jgi:transcriptional regulator with XRE-family HTH domain